MNSTVLVCETPAVPAGTTTISYTLRLDSAPSPITNWFESSRPLTLEAVPDPVVTDFNPKTILLKYAPDSSGKLKIYY